MRQEENMDFEQLYNVYYMQVYSYVMTLIKNGHLAEEITQDVFFKPLKGFHSYQGRSGSSHGYVQLPKMPAWII